jgi:hypothetical protein
VGDCTLFQAAVAPREVHCDDFFGDRRYRYLLVIFQAAAFNLIPARFVTLVPVEE